MNIKKIIPLSLAVLGVTSFLNACSNDADEKKVVGADEQPNTMAENSSMDEILARLKQSKSRTSVAIVMDENGVRVDSANAHETFDKTLDSIFDGGILYAGRLNHDSLQFKSRNSSFALYRGNGVVQGPVMITDMFMMNRVLCSVSQPENEYYHVQLSEDGRATKEFWAYDSTLIEQFKENCAHEEGTYSVGENRSMEFVDDDGSVRYNPVAKCVVEVSVTDGSCSYEDPYLKKYGSMVVDRCFSESEQ